MATGSTIGGLLGAGVGAAFGAPTVGYNIGSTAGGLAEGLINWNNAKNNRINSVDPRQRILYDSIVRRRRALDTGIMYKPQQDMINLAGSKAMNAATSVTGGDLGATISALNLINRGTGRNLNELYASMGTQFNQLLNQQNALAQLLNQRDYQVKLADQQQELGFAADTFKQGMEGMNALMARAGTTTSDNDSPIKKLLNLLRNKNDQ